MSDINDISDINFETYSFTLSTSAITEIIVKMTKKEEIDVDLEEITSWRVGRILEKICFIKNRVLRQGAR